MSVNTPPPTAFTFSLTAGNGKSYDLAIFANQIFPEEVGLRTVFRESNSNIEWKYVLEPSMYKENVATDELLMEAIKSALSAITTKIKEFFVLDGGGTTEPPVELIDRIAAVIKDQIEWDSTKNELRLK